MGFRIVATARFIDSDIPPAIARPVVSSGVESQLTGDIMLSPMDDIQGTGLPSPPDEINIGRFPDPIYLDSQFPRIIPRFPFQHEPLLRPTARRPATFTPRVPVHQMIPALRDHGSGDKLPPPLLNYERRPPEIVSRERPVEGDEWMWRPRRSFDLE
jgi:hypothetical protein